VDVQIKELVSEIETHRQKEDAEKDRIENQQEQENTINSNLQKAADALQDLLDSVIIKP
jgi:hypothetical protein